jgi:hypothetical protein
MDLPEPDPSPLSMAPPCPQTTPSENIVSTGRKRLRPADTQPTEDEGDEEDTPVIATSSLEVEVASTKEGKSWTNIQNKINNSSGSSSLPRWMGRTNVKSDPSSATTLDYRLSNFEEDDSDIPIDDFDPSEWTPPDSSYGAAIPVAGWIPKGIRRNIELCVSVILLALIGYLIITTSMRVERSKHDDDAATVYKNDGTNSKGLDLDDDRYIHYDNGKNNNKNNNNNDADTDEDQQEYEEDVDDQADEISDGQEGQGNRMLLFYFDGQLL